MLFSYIKRSKAGDCLQFQLTNLSRIKESRTDSPWKRQILKARSVSCLFPRHRYCDVFFVGKCIESFWFWAIRCALRNLASMTTCRVVNANMDSRDPGNQYYMTKHGSSLDRLLIGLERCLNYPIFVFLLLAIILTNSWFEHDVTKNQTKTLRFFWVSTFLGITAPKHLYVNKFLVRKGSSFCERDAWISRLLRDAAFSWRQGKLLCGLKHQRFWEILLSKHSLSQNKYQFNLYEFLKRRIPPLSRKTRKQMFLFVSGGVVSLKGTPIWPFHTKLYEFV